MKPRLGELREARFMTQKDLATKSRASHDRAPRAATARAAAQHRQEVGQGAGRRAGRLDVRLDRRPDDILRVNLSKAVGHAQRALWADNARGAHSWLVWAKVLAGGFVAQETKSGFDSLS